MARFGEHAAWFEFTSDLDHHNPEEDPASEDDWALMLRSLEKGRTLGITRFRETEIDAESVATPEDVFREAGIELERTPPR